MKIIPVIDLMDGQAVHARGGRRSAYKPLESRLCEAAHRPLHLIGALLTRHPFKCVYIADLDAIRGSGDNKALIKRIKRHFPRLRIWLDEGIRDRHSLSRLYAEGLATPVIGSETLVDPDVLNASAVEAGGGTPILSLDYIENRFLGLPRLESDPSLWSEKVILMTLSRVGSAQGPAMAALRRIRGLSPRTKLYAAGGMRNAQDLERVHALGLAGVLIASALHDERIGPDVLASYDG